jgi:hypothetical protein
MSVWHYTPTPSTAAAMAVLRAHRAAQIAIAQQVAVHLIRRKGKTNSREVWEVMRLTGVLDTTVKDHWLGAVFRDKAVFKWTGTYVIPTLPNGTLIHQQRHVKEWTLI